MRTFLYVKETQEIISKHCSIKAAQRQQSIMPIDGNKYEIIPISELPVSVVYVLAYSIDPMEKEDIFAVFYHYQEAHAATTKNVKDPRYFLLTPRIYFKMIYWWSLNARIFWIITTCQNI